MRELEDYHEQMDAIVSHVISKAQAGDRNSVLKIAKCLVDQVNLECEVDCYPSYSRIEGVITACRELIYATADEEKADLLRSLADFLGSDEYTMDLSVDLLPVLLEQFPPERVGAELRDIALDMTAAAYDEDVPDGYGNGAFSLWAETSISLLSKDPDAPKTVEELARKYWPSRSMRLLYADWLTSQKQYEQALAVLDENDAPDPASKSPASESAVMRRRLLRALGREKENRAPLWKLVLTADPVHLSCYSSYDMTSYRELKELYTPEEWTQEAPRAYKHFKGTSILPKLYLEDGKISELAELVQATDSMNMLLEYGDVLKDEHAPMLLDKYESLSLKMAAKLSNRNDYRHLADILAGRAPQTPAHPASAFCAGQQSGPAGGRVPFPLTFQLRYS